MLISTRVSSRQLRQALLRAESEPREIAQELKRALSKLAGRPAQERVLLQLSLSAVLLCATVQVSENLIGELQAPSETPAISFEQPRIDHPKIG